jgi:hypothetical protein
MEKISCWSKIYLETYLRGDFSLTQGPLNPIIPLCKHLEMNTKKIKNHEQKHIRKLVFFIYFLFYFKPKKTCFSTFFFRYLEISLYILSYIIINICKFFFSVVFCLEEFFLFFLDEEIFLEISGSWGKFSNFFEVFHQNLKSFNQILRSFSQFWGLFIQS